LGLDDPVLNADGMGPDLPIARTLPSWTSETPEFRSWWTCGGFVRAGFVLGRA
jgi:hypothetical protein